MPEKIGPREELAKLMSELRYYEALCNDPGQLTLKELFDILERAAEISDRLDELGVPK